MVSDREISIMVEGPDQMDIIVVDLPGLITAGPGQQETKDLVLKYTRPTETLILLVSEAQMDEQNVPARDIAHEVDPNGERTLRILTKFDALDVHDEDMRQQAVELVQTGMRDRNSHSSEGEAGEPSPKKQRIAEIFLASTSSLLPHAVVCRVKSKAGDMLYDQMAEREILSRAGISEDRAGIAMLKERLPPMFSERIAAEIPRLDRKARELLNEATQDLRLVGRQPQGGESLIVIVQKMLQDMSDEFERDVGDAHQKLKEQIHATQSWITEEWVGSHFRPNNIKPPLFQGEHAFNKCLSAIVEWWHPMLTQYMKEIKMVCEKCGPKDVPGTTGLSAADDHFSPCLPLCLRSTLAREWQSYLEDDMMKNFHEKVRQSLVREKIFATANHYVESKYAADVFLPEELVNNFVDNLSAADVFKMNSVMDHTQANSGLETEQSLKLQFCAPDTPLFDIPKRIELKPGDFVVVLSDFQSSNSENRFDLKTGMRGVVQEIDRQGSAFISLSSCIFRQKVSKKHFNSLRKVEEKLPESGTDTKTLLHPLDELRRNLKEKWLAERSAWVNDFGRRSIYEQQRFRVHAEVKAVCTVEKKTFTYMVLKDTIFEIIEKRKTWIDQDLLLNRAIRESALEDFGRRKMREDALRKEKNMKVVIEKLKNVK